MSRTRPPSARRTRGRAVARLGAVALLLAAWPSLADLALRAGSLASVSPAGASPGVAINITGTGFHTTAASNEVTFTHTSGAAATAAGTLIQTVNATQGLRRLRVTVPSGLPPGTAALRVRNVVTGEVSLGQNVEIVTLSIPDPPALPRGATQAAVRITGSINSQFQAGSSRAAFVTGITVHATTVESPSSLVATISIASTAPLGPNAVSVISGTQTHTLPNAFTVVEPNRPPAITSTEDVDADEGEPYAYQVVATDPDGDPLTYRLVSAPAGMSITGAGLVAWTPVAAQVGSQGVELEVSDGRGGTARQSFQIAVAAAPALESIELTPPTMRFSAAGQTRQVEVVGHRANDTTVDLTAAASGTTYENSNPFVASVSSDGLVTGLANGSTTITARNGLLSDTAAVTVEIDVTLDALELTPAVSTLRASGAQQPLRLVGRFSDGTTRDLTSDAGTSYASSNALAASVTPDGLATAAGAGETTITARHDALSATALLRVVISAGAGYLRGEVFDDSRGQPLGGATITLVSDGGGPLAPPVTTVADDRGRFTLAGRAGDAVVRIHKSGFTAVERRGTIPIDAAATLLDARLTPVPIAPAPVSSAFGGAVRDASGLYVLQIPPGGVATDLPLSVTPVSPQGLAGRLPFGWSPVAAAAIEPADILFGLPATLRLPNAADLPPGTSMTLARYSSERHQWIALGSIAVNGGGLTLEAAVPGAGHYAVLAPDTAPAMPPAAIPGEPIAGVDAADTPPGSVAAGDVVPRSAPPGDDVRALGRVGLTTPVALSSGVVLQARVNERFDLLDQSQVVTQPFTQDLVLYALPRPPAGGTLGATFPITPSRSFTIQQLMLGVIRLDVAAFDSGAGATVVDAGGGSVTNAEGDALELPPGAVSGHTAVQIHRLPPAELALAFPDFELLAAVRAEAVGAVFARPASLSIPAPAGVTADQQIFVGHLYPDPFAVRRLRLVSVARLAGGRLVNDPAVSGLTLPGIAGEGDYLFLRSTRPYGFTSGSVSGPAGPAARPGALVTSSSGPFSDVTALDGRFIVANPASVADTVRAVDPLSRAAAAGGSSPPARDAVVALDLPLVAAGLTVLSVNPAAGAANVPLDSSITIDFAAAVDPASVTDASAQLQAGGAAVAVTRTLSADRRRLTLRPASPLLARTTFSIVLTPAIRDTAGNALAGYVPASFGTLDPSRPPQPAAGQIVAELPDEDGFVLVTGHPGASAARSAVVVVNMRTQESAAVLSLADGSFRVRLPARVGDELSLILRDAGGRDTTLALTQLGAPGGAAAIGARGGTFSDADGRVGAILPRALAQPGVFELTPASEAPRPALPAGFTYADRFGIAADGAVFAGLASVTLSESQGRFVPQTAADAPFESSGSLTTPGDALINSSLQFTATAVDATGARRTVAAATTIVAGSPDLAVTETMQGADFPTVVLEAPRQTVPLQQVTARAIAATARVDIERPAALPGVQPGDTLLLVRPVDIGGQPLLEVVDRLVRVEGAQPLLRTAGRELPGLTGPGDYSIVATGEPIVFVSGEASGAAAAVLADGLPFVVRTGGANGRFVVPVPASQPFTLRILDLDGAARGTTSGVAPAAGRVDVGSPLGAASGRLTLTAQPDSDSIVDLATPIVFRFSEPIEERGLASAIVVLDAAGSRVFGRMTTDPSGSSVTFRPARRWRYATTYRYAVAATLTARSGARLAAPFTREFTTFRPGVVGTLELGDTRDVAVSGGLAVAATATGLATVNVASPTSPAVHSHVALPGGAAGVALLPGASIVDRTGATRAGTFAVAATGSAATAGAVRTFDLASPASPVEIGSAQVSAAPGAPPPPPVPAFIGTPRSVVVDADSRALVAIEDVGVASVLLGQSIPADAANPGAALGPRYPAGAESASQAVRLGDRILVAGTAGLTVLDAATLARRGGVSTEGSARGVAALAAFPMDLNGDGVVVGAEIFDLAVVANGADGTVQFYRVPAAGNPVLLSAVRLPGGTESVALDAAERLAYVGLGVRGIAIVDLDGPASVAPIDGDRNTIDDRLMGQFDTSGAAGRVALDLASGVGLVANGRAGVAIAQLLPPRTAILTLDRDPLKDRPGDETSILHSREAITSDDALRVTLTAASAGEPLFLVIEETPGAGSERLLRLEDGGTSTPLLTGLNTIAIDIHGGADSPASGAVLRIQTAGGQLLTSLELRIVPPSTAGARLQTLLVTPADAAIPANRRTVQLAVGGLFSDGRVLNLTSAETGTVYASLQPAVATVGADGLVTAAAGGTADIVVTNAGTFATVRVRVEHAPALVALEPPRRHLTLTAPGPGERLRMQALFSDGTVQDASESRRSVFTSSDPSVVAVAADGSLTALGEGVATITVTNGPLQEQVQVAVEFRTPAALTGLAIAPFDALTTDAGEVRAKAQLTGTGSLDDIPVTFSITGLTHPAVVTRSTGEGVAIGRFRGVGSPGTFTVTASVVSPADGVTLTASAAVTVSAGSGDHEPNNEVSSASTLAVGRTIQATLDAASDRDVYRLESTTDGALTVVLTLPHATAPPGLAMVFLTATGAELQRVAAGGRTTVGVHGISAGSAFVRIETGEGPVAYALTAKIAQAAVVVESVQPAGGPPGTAVAITGTGFSVVTRQNLVFFGRIAARVTSATSTRIDVIVPAAAADGPVRVVVKGRQATGPAFVTGRTDPPPPVVMRPPVTRHVRFDPATAQTIDLQRLIVHFDPGAARSEVEALVASTGGTIAGELPNFNGYVLEFPSVTTIRGLNAIRQQLRESPIVVSASQNVERRPRQGPLRFDTRDTPATFPGSLHQVGVAYAQARIFEALAAIRRTPPFNRPLHAGQPGPLANVKIAVIDTGFAPSPALLAREFSDRTGAPIVDYINAMATPTPAPSFLPTAAYADPGPYAHGTMVVSAIAAVNDGGQGSGTSPSSLSGALNGLFHAGEAPFRLVAYGIADSSGQMFDEGALAALTDIANRGDIDVVNMSWGTALPTLALADADKDKYRPYFAALGSTLIVTAAGEEGIDEEYSSPTSIAAEPGFEHVMSIGASAVTQGGADTRAFFGDRFSFAGRYDGQPCDPASPLTFLPTETTGIASSNCGSAVTMAAPGQDLWVVEYGNRYGRRQGTSLAAPLVASVAALLRAISPGSTPLELRDLLVESGDPITGVWDPGPMRRLNALEAVRRRLPVLQQQRIYVADQEADHIVALEVDPMTGDLRAQLSSSLRDKEIPLTFTTASGLAFQGAAPRSVAMSPTGKYLYVIVEAVAPAGYGDGVLIVNTLSEEAEAFIPLSGRPFPPVQGGAAGAAVVAPRHRIPMVVSRDGRLLYIGVGTELKVVNVQDGKAVRSYFDLPAEYFIRAFTRPVNEFQDRLQQIPSRIGAGVPFAPGAVFISDMALSHDGKMLYAAFQRGGGGGNQPGGALAIDVDLYTDASPNELGLQSDLTSYLTLSGSTLEMIDVGPVGTSGDEPTAIAVGADNRHVYLFNGGYEAVTGISVEGLHAADYASLLGAVMFPAAGPTLGAIMLARAAMNEHNSTLYARLLNDLRRHANDGIAIMVAPGFTAAFDTAGGNQHVWSFPADVSTGWNGSLESPLVQSSDFQLVVDQFSRPEVYAKLPSAVTMKPRGRDYRGNERALVAFGFTGNFGLLDLTAQAAFRNVPDPDPAFAGLNPEMFHALVGVTPSIPIGHDAIPERGAVKKVGVGDPIPSLDEPFLNTSDIEYAQNGRFAVAAHAGRHPPKNVMMVVPDFVSNLEQRQRLIERGFTYSGGNEIHRNGSGVSPGAQVGLRVGGGGLSIISDRAIEADIDANLGDIVAGSDGADRPYHAGLPICDVIDRNGATPVPHCLTEAVSRVTRYLPSGPGADGGEFHRLRGLAIQPFAMIEAPRHGDHVTRHTAVHVTWRDERVNRFETSVWDLDATVDASGNPVDANGLFVHASSGALTPEQQAMRAMTADFLGLFEAAPSTTPPPPASSLHPLPNRRYRVEVHLLNGEEVFSTAFIEVRYENLIGPPAFTRIDLSPTIVPFMLTPGGAQLSVMMRPNGAPAEDVTSQALYAWINGSANGGFDLPMDPSAVIAGIRGHLQATADPGVNVAFDAVPATITAGGAVTLSDPGIQIVAARFDGIDSRPTVVLGGFNVGSISVETIGAESAFEADSLTAGIVAALGPGTNAPLVIAPSDSTYIDDDGQIALADVVLRYVGGGYIRLNDLMDALRGLPSINGNSFEQDFQEVTLGNLAPIGATPTWRNAQALVELMEGPGAPSLNYELDLVTSNVSTAFALTASFFGARIASNSSGLAVVTGTLDLGRLGTGTDGVLVWSLPPLESARLRPAIVGIRRSDAPTPGPSVRATATTTPVSATVPTPAGFLNDLTALREILPLGFGRTANLFAVDHDFGRFSVSAHGFASGGSLQFSDFQLTFDVPNDEAPRVTNTYGIVNPAIAAVGVTDRFVKHVVHQNAVGVSRVAGAVHVDGLGDASTSGYVAVCDCTGPILFNELLGPTTVQPGDVVQYQLAALNPTTAPLPDTPITVEFRLSGVLISTTTLGSGAIDADAARVLPLQVTAPFGGGVLQATVAAAGFTPIHAPAVTVTSPSGGLVISEMVLDPRQDWNDSAGGNGTPFDATPGSGPVDANDVWIEIMSPTTGTQGWTIRLTDAAGASSSIALGAPSATQQVRVLAGFGPMTLPVRRVEVVDSLGLVRQSLDIQGIEQVLGTATGPADESLTWSINGSPTPLLQQFLRRTATIGAFLPF